MRALLAPPLAQLTLSGEPALYDAKGLFEYIDGAAPLFIDRGFRMLAAAELKTEGGGELTCDVYDMGTPAQAAAIYDKEKPSSARPLTVGDAAHKGPMSLVLRRGPYYVKMTAFDARADAVLPELASTLVSRVP